MATNLYHLLRFLPATEAWEMPPALEALAAALVRSGKLRINADTERNFVRLGIHATDRTLTARELTDPALLPTTRALLGRHVAPAEGPQGVTNLMARLLGDLKKARGVNAEKEMRVARVLVQSAHPAVIQLLLQSGTELFVSYSHNVSDLMAVHDWDTHGTASGLQATELSGTAVYVSAGGDPFFEGEQKHYLTDGFPALARMVVIAGQELGHFADLRRNSRGIIGRHSTDLHHTQLRADPTARDGRLSDMQQVARLQRQYLAAGLSPLRRAERNVTFYKNRHRYLRWGAYQFWRILLKFSFIIKCKRLRNELSIKILPFHFHGQAVELFISDMAFNLAPDADSYRNPDPLIEEAIMVIESVARVPQQVHKWGHNAVKLAWPHLYAFYFEKVIPAVIQSVSSPILPQPFPLLRRLSISVRRILRPRPGYYPENTHKPAK